MSKNRDLVRIIGSKKGGGGGQSFQADDNLFARQSASFVDLIAEGPIKGLVYGDASIFVDETRLRDVQLPSGEISGESNIANFKLTTATGTATQSPDASFFAEYPTASITEPKNGAVLKDGVEQRFTISSSQWEKDQADYLKITLFTNAMQKIIGTGDNKGNTYQTTVNFNIKLHYVNTAGATKEKTVFRTGFSGKVTSKYSHTFGFNIEDIKKAEGIQDWAIGVERLSSSPKSNDSGDPEYTIFNDVFVESIEAAIADKLEYPYSAYVAGVVDAEQFGSVPKRGYEVDGKLISIPSNHVPIDYDGKKITVADAANFDVGGVVAISKTCTIAITGTQETGYTGTATFAAAHGFSVGKAITCTFSGATTGPAAYINGDFVCAVATSTTITFTLSQGDNAITDTSPDGTITCTFGSGGTIDKKVSNTLYLRDIAATNSLATTATITVTNPDTTTGTSTISASEKCLIPANYRRNSTTEKLTTSDQDWDGTFYASWCNNPAWVLYDLLTNKIYGSGNQITDSQVNKWELFQIGRYCDELVPAGIPATDLLSLYTTSDANYTPGGSTDLYEPRFSCNLVLQGQQEAYKVINDIGTIFRGMTYWLNGEAYVVQDSEKDPVYQFTNGNVTDGVFQYEGNARSNKVNQVMVKWNNPQDHYRQRVEYVEDEEELQNDATFIKPHNMTGFGCTSRGQARRLGKWKLLTEKLNTQTIQFKTSANASFVRPGDLIQVIDNSKNGKNWGGRLKTGSTTGSIKLDRQWEKEAGYDYNDYLITCSFVGYKGLLAQDSATIGSTSYSRNDQIPNVTSATTAAQIQDDSGNDVQIQWTPYTYTETRFVDDSDNAANSAITIDTAEANTAIFGSAPAADAIWIISRAALATGKSKEEAAVFRVLAITETATSELEIIGVEYNASKFDAVDKNEGIEEYRTIYLPNSLDTVPPPTNIRVFPIRRSLSQGKFTNVMDITWDPPLVDDAPYRYKREYIIEYSIDNEHFIGAGKTPGTDFEVEGTPDGTYYIRILLENMLGKRSVYATKTATLVFQDMEDHGSVGLGRFTVSIKGHIDTNMGINATTGLVTFSPDDFNHFDGKNESDVTNQLSLDFSGLSNGQEAYVLFDNSASAFKAVRWNSTGDNWYEVGSTEWAAGTGTLTHVSGNTTGALTGSGTNFDPEMVANQVFKVRESSVDYYPRIESITNDTNAILAEPFAQALTNNSTWYKTAFAPDFTNDTIAAKVKRVSATNYQLNPYINTTGESSYSIFGTNENHTFPADANNEISTSNYAAFTNDFTVKKGTTAYTFASSGTAANTFGLTLNARTGFSADADINIHSTTGQITIDDNTLDSITSATATIRITDLARGTTIGDRIISFSKAVSGSATAGTNAITIKLIPNQHVIAYDTEGAETDTITFTTSVQGGDELDGTAYYEFLVDGAAPSGGAVNSTTSTWTLPDANEPAVSGTKTIKVQLRDGSTSGTVKAIDTVGLYGVKSGTDAYTCIVTNEAHTVPSSTTGTPTSYAGSGTDIRVFKGSTALTHEDSGTPGVGEFKVAVNSDTNITVNASPSTVTKTTTNDTRRYGVASAMDDDTAEIEFSINCENLQTITKSQTFALSKQGTTGANAKVVVVTPTTQVMFKESEPEMGGTFTWYNPPSITISAKTTNTTADGAWSNSGGNMTVVSSAHANPSVTVSSAQIADGMTVTYTLHSNDGGSSDSVTLELIDVGDSGITAILSNETHTYQAGSDGAVTDVTGSGTTITLYEGSIPLDYDGTGTADGHWKVNSISNESGLTEGTASAGSGTTGRSAVISNHTPTTGTDSYTITYNLTGKTSSGKAIDVDKIQTLTKAKAGATGSTGSSVNIVFARAASVPSTPTASSGIPSQDIQWYDTPPSGTNLLWASRGLKGVGETNFTWTTPFQAEGAAHAEVYIYRKNSNAGNSGGSYNFVTNVLTVPTNWAKNPQALTADGDKVYVSVGLATGASTATAASVTWGTPAVYAERTDGEQGDPGAVGKKEVVGVLYATAAGYNTTPSMTNYTFSTRVFTGGNASSWTLSPPSLAGATVNTWYQCSYAVTETTAAGNTGTPSFGTPTPRVSGFGGVITLDEDEIDIENIVNGANAWTYAGYANLGFNSSGYLKLGVHYDGVNVSAEHLRGAKEMAYAGLNADGYNIKGLKDGSNAAISVATLRDSNTRTQAGFDSSGNVKRAVSKSYGGFGEDITGKTGAPYFSSAGNFAFGEIPATHTEANDYTLPTGVPTGVSVTGETITFTRGAGGNVSLTNTDTHPSAATVRGHFSGTGINTTTGVITNSTYSAGDFNIESLDGYDDGTYKNSSVTYAELVGTKPPTNAEANPSQATIRGYFSGSGINTTTGVITNSTYSSSDFTVAGMSDYTAAAYSNSHSSVANTSIVTFEVAGGATHTWSKYADGNYNPVATTYTFSVTWRNGAGTSVATSTVVLNLDSAGTHLDPATITLNASGSGVTQGTINGNNTTEQTITLLYGNVACTLKGIIHVVTGFTFKFDDE